MNIIKNIENYFFTRPNLINSQKKMRSIVLYIVSFFGILFTLGFGALTYFNEKYFISLFDFITASILILSVLYFKKTKKYTIASYFIVSGYGLLFIILLSQPETESVAPLWSMLYPLITIFLLGRKKGTLFDFIFLIIAIFLMIFPFSFIKAVYPQHYVFRFISSFIAIMFIASFYEYCRENVRKQVLEKNLQLEKYISELEFKEKKIEESRRKYQQIYEHSGTAMLSFGDDKIIKLCNDDFVKMSGLEKKDIIGKLKWTKFVAQNDLKRMKKYHQLRSDNKKAPSQYEFNFIDKDGNEKKCLLSIAKISNSEERIASILDISEMKKMETTKEVMLNISNAAMKTGNLYDFIDIIRKELQKVLDTKNFYIALYNKEKDEISLPFQIDSKDHFDSFPAGKTLTAYVIKQKRSVLATEKDQKELHKKGLVEQVGTLSKVWLGVPLINDEEVIGIVAVQSYQDENRYSEKDKTILEYVSDQIARNITRKQIEENLKKEKIQFEELFNNSPEAIILGEKDSSILKINPAFTEIFGYTAEEAIGKDIDSLINMDNFNEAKDLTKKVAAGKLIRKETVRRRKDGSPVEVSIIGVPFKAQSGEIKVYGVYRDISDRKKAERIIKSQQNHLKLVNKILRHDITNNLAVVRSALRIYKKTNDKTVLDEAKKSVEKSTSLIQEMRELENFILANKELYLCNIRKILEDVKEKYNQVKINIEGEASVLADKALRSVLDNIISNAIRHGETDKIDISIKNKKIESVVDIADYGHGIPDEYKDKIFDEKFKYGEKAHTGLGLYLVKETMKRYGGDVYVKDNEAKGTIFSLYFKKGF